MAKKKKKSARRQFIGGLDPKKPDKKNMKPPKRGKKSAAVVKGGGEDPKGKSAQGDNARGKRGGNAGAGGPPASAIGPAPAMPAPLPPDVLTAMDEVRRTETIMVGKKADATRATKAHEEAQKTLMSKLDEHRTGQGNLFTLNLPGATPKPAPDAWKKEKVGVLDIPEKLRDKLIDAGIDTLGDLTERQARGGDWWRKIRGVGESAAAKIEEALAEYWAANPQTATPHAPFASGEVKKPADVTPEPSADPKPDPKDVVAKMLEEAGKVADSETEWKAEKVTKLKLGKDVNKKLKAAGVNTLGALATALAGNVKIAGFDDAGMGDLFKALDAFWKELRGETPATPAPESAAADKPLLAWSVDENDLRLSHAASAIKDAADKPLGHWIEKVNDEEYTLGGSDALYPETQNHTTFQTACDAAEKVEREARAERDHDQDKKDNDAEPKAAA